MIEQRSMLIFNHAISTEATRKCYLNELKRFKEFYNITDFDSLAHNTFNYYKLDGQHILELYFHL